MPNNLHISYDLFAPKQDYSAVESKVKSLGSWAKLGNTFWFVSSDHTSTEARDIIKSALDSNDKLYVVDATNNTAAWYGLSDQVTTYVRENWA